MTYGEWKRKGQKQEWPPKPGSKWRRKPDGSGRDATAMLFSSEPQAVFMRHGDILIGGWYSAESFFLDWSPVDPPERQPVPGMVVVASDTALTYDGCAWWAMCPENSRRDYRRAYNVSNDARVIHVPGEKLE